MAATAIAILKAFRDEASNEAREQSKRMERAMVLERAYGADVFSFIIDHPVLGVLARRLLWQDANGMLFRVGEDGTFADVHDAQTVTTAPFTIVHPINLDDRVLAKWANVFADCARCARDRLVHGMCASDAVRGVGEACVRGLAHAVCRRPDANGRLTIQ